MSLATTYLVSPLIELMVHLDANQCLGTYAVKKIAVGRSKAYLVKMLREVRLLEALRHPNIIPYHHSWVDTTRFSKYVLFFSPVAVPPNSVS